MDPFENPFQFEGLVYHFPRSSNPKPLLFCFMAATNKLDIRNTVQNKKTETLVKKYRLALAKELERISKKRTPLSRSLLEQYPTVIEDLNNDSSELGEQLVLIINQLLKADQRAAILRFDENGIPLPFDVEQEKAEHYIFVQKHSQGGYHLLRTEEHAALPITHPLVARYMSTVEERNTASQIAPSEPEQNSGEIPEHTGEVLILSNDDFEIVPFEQDFVIERVVRPTADQMHVEHLVADLQYLMPHRKHLHEVAELVKHPEVNAAKKMRFSQYPIVTIDEVLYEKEDEYLNEMRHHQKQHATTPFVRPIYVQERDLELPEQHTITTNTTAIANTFDASHDHPALWLLPSKDADLNGPIGEIMCKAIPAKKLCQYAQQYGFRCGDKSTMCKNLTPFLYDILHDYRKPDYNKALYEELQNALTLSPIFVDDVQTPHPLEIYGTLREDGAKATGVLHIGNAANLSDVVVFDIDAYVKKLQNAKKGDVCTVYPFLKDDVVSYQAVIKSNRDGVLRLTDTFDGTDRFVNTLNLEDNYMFVHPHPIDDDFVFAKHRLLDTNIAVLSSTIGISKLQQLLSIDVEQFAHYHNSKTYAPHLRNTVADRDLNGYTQLSKALRELFAVSSVLKLTQKERQSITSFLKGRAVETTSSETVSPSHRIKVPDWIVRSHPHATGRVPDSLDELLHTLVQENPIVLEEMVKSLHENVHRNAISNAMRKIEGMRIREDHDSADDQPPVREIVPLPSVDMLIQQRSLALLHEYGDAHRDAFDEAARRMLLFRARRLRNVSLDLEDTIQEHLNTLKYYRTYSGAQRNRLRGPKMVAPPRVEHDKREGTLHMSDMGIAERDDANLSATDVIAQMVTTEDMNKTRTSSELRDVCHALGVVLAQKDVEIIERDVFMLVILQMQTLRNTKRTLSAKEQPLYQRFARLVSYSALVLLVIQLQHDPPVLSKEHAPYFASDGYPLRERKDGRGTLEYVSRVLMTTFGEKLPFMSSVDNLRARIKNTVAFYLNRNKGMAKQLERLAATTVKKKGIVATVVARRYIRAAHRRDHARVMNRRGRTIRMGTVRSVLPFQEDVKTTSRVEVLKLIDLVQSDEHPDEMDSELTSLIEQTRELFKLDMTMFVDRVVLAKSHPAGFRASFGPEIAHLVYSVGLSKLVENEKHIRNSVKCASGTLIEAFRAIEKVCAVLLGTDVPNTDDADVLPPMRAIAMKTEPDIIQCVEALGRAVERGLRRLVLSVESNRLDYNTLKRKEDQLREKMMAEKLQVYQDMEPEERGILKMLKDAIGFEMASPSNEDTDTGDLPTPVEPEPTHLDVMGENDDDGDEEIY